MPASLILPPVNADPLSLLPQIRTFALDMDGTVYLGERWIDGARDFLDRIAASGRRYLFLTNNSSKNPGVYVEKLARMGLPVTERQIITSGQATIWYLKRYFPGRKVFLLGNELLRQEFDEAGIPLEDEHPDVVVVGFDTTLTYAKLCKVCDFVRAGLPYLSTHPDYNCPTETGFVPDAGAIHAFIHASAFRYPDRVIGKPNTDITDYLLERLREQDSAAADNTDTLRTPHAPTGNTDVLRTPYAPAGNAAAHAKSAPALPERSSIAMVGDRLYTDIAAGRNGGLRTILVLSGEATLEDAAVSDVTPDLIYSSVAEIPL
ncbi:MAG: HAD-IIA family hydrolase [Eubacteriales bacterium]|nr:HAD-IIA family hydrolase [Eubacteriales bacterium]